MSSRYQPLAVAAVFVALVVAAQHDVLPLLAWTRRVFPKSGLPVAFALLFAGYLAQRHAPAPWRPWAILVTSLALAAWFHPGFALLMSVWGGLFFYVLRAKVAHWCKVAFVVATVLAWALASHVPLAPRWHAAHPELLAWGYVFGAGMTFRVVWALHEAKVSDERMGLRDLLSYLFFAPFFVVLPYMYAILEPRAFREALARRDPEIERSGLRAIVVSAAGGGLLYLVTTYAWSPRDAFEAALHQRRLVAAVLVGLAYYPFEVTAIAVFGSGIVIGLVRLLGVPLGPSFRNPLAARTITEWWQRWNTHFRDLLVALCWYPVMLRLRRRPYLGIWVGCAAVFLLGSVSLHWAAKHPFHNGSTRNLPMGIVFESMAMTLVVGASMSWARWRKHQPRRAGADGAASWAKVALERLRTYVVVFATVVVVGYGATYVFSMRPFERLAPAVARASALIAAGRHAEAAALLGPHTTELCELAWQSPLDPLRQSAAAMALALPTPARDLSAAADHLALARAYLDPRAATQREWTAVAETLIEPELP